MYLLNYIYKINSYQFLLLLIISLNVIFIYSLNLSYYDQIINLMISYGIYSYYLENKFKVDKNIFYLQKLLAFSLLFFILFRAYWLHIGDNFIYLLFPLLLFNLFMLFFKFSNINKNKKPILISLLFPVTKVLFIPFSIILNPFSTIFTWLSLNAFGFTSTIVGQEIFFQDSGINVTFSCSGSGQILFCFTAMIILNIFFPLKSSRLFIVLLSRAFLVTFFFNILRL